MQEQTGFFLTPVEKLGYKEEYVILNEENLLLKYSLSNNLEDIKMAIFTQTRCNIDLEKVYWKLNPNLSIYVKHLMNKHRVIFSMTTWQEKKDKNLVVNMRVNDKWFFTGFSEYDGVFYSWDQLNLYKLIMRAINRIISIDNDDD